MRALRLLPAGVPHVSVMGARDGFAARAHLLDEGAVGRARSALGDLSQTFRSLPRLPGMCDGLPLRSQIRPIDRTDPRRGGAAPPADALGPLLPRAALQRAALPRAPARDE